jgi:hypothetical protein
MSRPLTRSLIVGLLLASACATEETELSRRVRGMQQREAAEISDPAHTRLELTLADGATTWCPASLKPAQLRATVHTPTTILYTPVRLKAGTPGYLPRATVVVNISGATLGPEWLLAGPTQPSALLEVLNKPISINGHLQRYPQVASTLQLTTTFDCDQGGEFPGRPGRDGGQGGRNGENGEDGLDVVINVGYLRSAGGRKLVLVKVAPSVGPPAYFLLPPERRLGINIRGGDGGSGGGATLDQHGIRLTGGLGGDGGNGGRAAINVDPRYPELRPVVTVVNPGGRGGDGGSNDDFQGTRAAAGRPGRAGAPARQQNVEPEKMFSEEIEAGVPILGTGQNAQI